MRSADEQAAGHRRSRYLPVDRHPPPRLRVPAGQRERCSGPRRRWSSPSASATRQPCATPVAAAPSVHPRRLESRPPRPRPGRPAAPSDAAAMALGVIVAEDDPRGGPRRIPRSRSRSHDGSGCACTSCSATRTRPRPAARPREWAAADEALAAGAKIRSEQGGPADEGGALRCAARGLPRDTDTSAANFGSRHPDTATAVDAYLVSADDLECALRSRRSSAPYDDVLESLELDPSGVNAPGCRARVQAASR